jgi:hypothetical protein
MEFSNIEKKTGFVFFYKLTDSNQDKTFEFTMADGNVIEVKYDMAFEDDAGSSDSELLSDETFHSIAFLVTKIVKDTNKHYRIGDAIVINPLTLPASYKLL